MIMNHIIIRYPSNKGHDPQSSTNEGKVMYIHAAYYKITSREARFARPLLYPSIVFLYVKHPICSDYTMIACSIFKE